VVAILALRKSAPWITFAVAPLGMQPALVKSRPFAELLAMLRLVEMVLSKQAKVATMEILIMPISPMIFVTRIVRFLRVEMVSSASLKSFLGFHFPKDATTETISAGTAAIQTAKSRPIFAEMAS
jgi:hypothetical protein